MEIPPKSPDGSEKSPQSKEMLASNTASTLCISSRSESVWTSASRSKWDIYHKPVIVVSVGSRLPLWDGHHQPVLHPNQEQKCLQNVWPGFPVLGTDAPRLWPCLDPHHPEEAEAETEVTVSAKPQVLLL